jgi:hypothetical protein
MNRGLYVAIFTVLLASFAIITAQNIHAEKGCNLPGTKHDDNSPSKSKFLRMAYHASLCEIAICVDSEECANHVKVDWDKFRSSPAYTDASDEEQKAMDKAHSHGVGAPGLVGYEFLDYIQHDKD